MPLIVPLSPYKDATERNLLALAESLGIECVQEPLKQIFASSSGNESAPANSCLVLNPQQIKRTLGDSILSHDTAARLCSQFRFLMICNLSLDPYCDQLVKILSGGLLRSVEMARTNRPYEVPAGDDGVCGPFSGLAFGTAGAGDFVLQADPQRPLPALTSITSIDGRPHMARMRRGNAELFFLAASEIADIQPPLPSSNPSENSFRR